MSFNLKTEDKVNLGLIIGGFVILLVIRNTAQMNAFEGPKYLATIGAILGLARWWATNKSNALKNLKSIFQTLLLDSDLSKKNLIPTGVPLVYELDQNLKSIKNYYLGDQEAIANKAAEVAAQGKSK